MKGEAQLHKGATYEEYKAFEASVSARQRKWLGHKAQCEHMSRWSVAMSWGVPSDGELDADGFSLPLKDRQ